MNSILVLGAGRSSSSLISYLLEQAGNLNLRVTVGDFSEAAAHERVGGHERGRAIAFDIMNAEASAQEISQANLVISLLPAHLHPLVAQHCLEHKKHLITASYVSDDMKALDAAAKSNGLLFLNECGLDPGIDHMSAMQVMDRIKGEGGVIHSFESFTGGLIAPETDPGNPWRYKFTWNARNVVMAGQSTAKYLQRGEYKYIPYQQLFQRITPVSVPGYGDYEGYANRDSLKYIDAYGLQQVKTMLRGTLRNKGFCSAWNVLVQLGCCEDTYAMERVQGMTHKNFMLSFLDSDSMGTAEQKIAARFGLSMDGEELKRLKWSGLFDDEVIGLDKGTPAQILEHILNKKWKLNSADKDMIVMWHRFGFEVKGKKKEIQASLIAKGSDSINTAMAQTVGLPLGMAAKALLEGKIKTRGVVIPTIAEIYTPVLGDLEKRGIRLEERERDVVN